MNINLFFKKLALCILSIGATPLFGEKVEVVDIANISDRPVGINYSVPEHTEALILLRQNKSTTIVQDVMAQVRNIKSPGANQKNNEILWAALLKQAITVEQFVKTGFNALKETPQIIEIRNNSDQTIYLDFLIPARTDGLVWLRPIKLINAQELLHQAIMNDSEADVRQAVKMGADVNLGRGDKPSLAWAVLLKKYNAVEALLECGAKPDNTLTRQSIKMHDIKSLLFFVKHGCQINFSRGDLLNIVIFSYRVDAVCILAFIKELSSHGYPINELWEAAICLAAFKSEGEEAVKFLLVSGANPNHIIKYGTSTIFSSPLAMAAAGWPNKQIVQILIEAGADINQKIKPDHSGESYTPLSCVIEKKCSGVSGDQYEYERKKNIELLVEMGASL